MDLFNHQALFYTESLLIMGSALKLADESMLVGVMSEDIQHRCTFKYICMRAHKLIKIHKHTVEHIFHTTVLQREGSDM